MLSPIEFSKSGASLNPSEEIEEISHLGSLHRNMELQSAQVTLQIRKVNIFVVVFVKQKSKLILDGLAR